MLLTPFSCGGPRQSAARSFSDLETCGEGFYCQSSTRADLSKVFTVAFLSTFSTESATSCRKSVGAENTFSSDLTEFEAMSAELQPLVDKVWRHCKDKAARGWTVTLKMKFNDFEIVTRSRSVPVAVASRDDLERMAIALLQNETPAGKPVRLLGVSLSSLEDDAQEERQLGLPI
jgi:nucleotidyltransferase/DNA polymerase involved in DNA repair